MLKSIIFFLFIASSWAALNEDELKKIKEDAEDWHILFLSDIIKQEFDTPPFNDSDIYRDATVTTIFDTSKSEEERMDEALEKAVAKYREVHGKYMEWDDQQYMKARIENFDVKIKRYAQYANFIQTIMSAKTLRPSVKKMLEEYRELLKKPEYYQKDADDRLEDVFKIATRVLTLEDAEQMQRISDRFKSMFGAKLAETYNRYINRNKGVTIDEAAGTQVLVNERDQNIFSQGLDPIEKKFESVTDEQLAGIQKVIDLACDVSLPINERHDRLANLATLVGLDEESKKNFQVEFGRLADFCDFMHHDVIPSSSPEVQKTLRHFLGLLKDVKKFVRMSSNEKVFEILYAIQHLKTKHYVELEQITRKVMTKLKEYKLDHVMQIVSPTSSPQIVFPKDEREQNLEKLEKKVIDEFDGRDEYNKK